MDFTTHQFAQGVVDEPVAGQRRLAGELCRDNKQAVMTAAAPRTGMTGMQRGVVNQFEAQGSESGQPFAHNGFEIASRVLRRNVAHAGKAFLKGLTLTRA